MDKKVIEKLQKIFYGKDLRMGSLQKLKMKVKELGLDISPKHIKYFYDGQEVIQRFRKYHKEDKSERKGKIINLFPFQAFYVDTMFLSKYGILIINGIDNFTKYAFSKVYRYTRSEELETNTSVTSKKAADALYEWDIQIRELGYKLTSVVHDAGVEFLGYFQKYLEENNIKNITTDVADKIQNSPVERLNYSIRLLIEKYVDVYGRKNLIGKIPDLVHTYNNSYHSAIKCTPTEALESKEVQEELQDTNKQVKSNTIPNKLRVDDSVRVYIKKDNDPFNKLSPNFSQEIYKIESYNKRNGKYKVNNKLYTENQLQKVDYVIPYDPTKTKEATKKQRELKKIKDYLSGPKETTAVEGRVTRSRAKKT